MSGRNKNSEYLPVCAQGEYVIEKGGIWHLNQRAWTKTDGKVFNNSIQMCDFTEAKKLKEVIDNGTMGIQGGGYSA